MLTSLAPFSGHLRGKGRGLVALFALGLLGAGASLAAPLIGKAFIDAVAVRGDFGVVPMVAAGLAALSLLDLGLGVVTRYVHARLSARVLVEIRERLFSRCLRLPLSHLESFRHGDLLTRFGSDVPRIQGLLVDGVLGSLQGALFLVVAAAILVHLSPVLAGWSFLGVFLALLLTAAFRGPVERGTRGIQEALADLSHFLAERLGAVRHVRLHGAEPQEEVRLGDLNRALVGRVLRFQVLDAAAGGLPGLALALGLAWIYLLGGRLLEAGEIGLGTFVAFVLYQGRLYAPARGLLGLVRNLQEARVSLQRVAEVLGEAEEEGPTPAGSGVGGRGEVHVEAVELAYPGKPPILRGLGLHVARGEKVALCGPSGAGKSTLVQLLFGLRRPSAGWVRVGGFAPGAGEDLRQVIGYAGAEPFLLHATVEENLTYGSPEADTAAVLRAARTAEAHEFILSLPQGYRTIIGGRGLALSDGQRQRLGVARLLVRAPPILVLDEAFSALDLDTEARVRRNLWREYPDRTVLLVTHRLGGLGQLDRLLLLDDGALHEVTEEELLGRLGAGAASPARAP
ncbi:MAG: ABC transporter ATP-binding protein [Deferrisomatales bacterium]|nr:ABC transporter ATP-binding protein [Deferrisomatales bacterium]